MPKTHDYMNLPSSLTMRISVNKCKVKCIVVPVHVMKAFGGSGGKAPFILNLSMCES
jgi:hypothetical protein